MIARGMHSTYICSIYKNAQQEIPLRWFVPQRSDFGSFRTERFLRFDSWAAKVYIIICVTFCDDVPGSGTKASSSIVECSSYCTVDAAIWA